MGIVRKQGILLTLNSYVAIALGAFAVIFIIPKYLTPEEFGIRSLVFDMGLILAQLFAAGGYASFLKYQPILKNNLALSKSLLLYLLIIPFLIIGLFTLINQGIFNIPAYFFQEKSPGYIPYFKYSILLGFLFVYTDFFELYCRINNSFFLPKFLKEVKAKIFSILILLLFGFGLITFEQFWIITILSYALILLFMVILANKLSSLIIGLNSSFLKKDNFQPILKYSSFSILNGGASLLVLKIDVFMIASIIDLSNTAIYSIAIFITFVIEAPRKALLNITAPLLSEAFNDGNKKVIEDLYKKTSINQLIIGSLFICLICANLDSLYAIMPNGKDYVGGTAVVLILSLAKLITMIFSLNGEIISFSKYYKFNTIAIIFLLICTIVTNYYFIQWGGILGASFATLLSILIFSLIKYFFVKWKLNYTPFTQKTIIALILILPFTILLILLDLNFHPLINIAIKSTITLTYFSLMIRFTNVSPDLKIIMNQILRKTRIIK